MIFEQASNLARTIEMAVQTLQPPSLIDRLRDMGIRPENEKEALSELTARRNISLTDEVLAVLPAEHPKWFNPNKKPDTARPLISELAAAAASAAPEEPPTFKIAPPPAGSTVTGGNAPPMPFWKDLQPEALRFWAKHLNALTLQKNPQGNFVLTGPKSYKVIPVEAALHGDTLAHDLMEVVAQLQSEPDDEVYEFTPIPARLENQEAKIRDLLSSLKNFTGVYITRDKQDRIERVELRDTAPNVRLVTEHLDESLSAAREPGADSKTPEEGRVSDCDECERMLAILRRTQEEAREAQRLCHEAIDQTGEVRKLMQEELDAAAAKLTEQERLTAQEESRRKLYGRMFERIRYVVIGEGPEEFIRLNEAMKKAGGKVAESWIYYLVSLWKEMAALRSELKRFKEGDLSAEEVHNLCHNLRADKVTPQQFCDGCEEYQKKLFGKSPIAELRSESRERGKLLEWAWAVIANAGGGNWGTQPKEWQEGAAKWRDEFHNKVPLL